MSAWTHVAPVELAERPAKGLVEVPVPPEVMALAAAGVGGSAGADEGGEAVPFVVRVDQAFAVNALSAPGLRRHDCSIRCCPRQAEHGRSGLRHARTADPDRRGYAGNNFRRRVSVEASQDATAWEVLKKTDCCFGSVTRRGHNNKSEVLLPDNDFRYLRITYSTHRTIPKQVVIRNVTARHIAVTEPQQPKCDQIARCARRCKNENNGDRGGPRV